jgi:hypothetical protein
MKRFSPLVPQYRVRAVLVAIVALLSSAAPASAFLEGIIEPGPLVHVVSGAAVSGEIIGAAAGIGPLGGSPACEQVAVCAQWLRSGCKDDQLHPRPHPSVMTSIDNVSALAGTDVVRVFVLGSSWWSLEFGDGIEVRFWTQGCREVSVPWLDGFAHRAHFTNSSHLTHFRIPAGVEWMTVNAASSIHTVWALY